MKALPLCMVLASMCLTVSVGAQENPVPSDTTLHITSRAVLVDVEVTDHNGMPVTGLKKDAFTITEQGRPQTITFFEEHRGLQPEQAAKIEFPQLPPNTFSNYSPIAPPPAVNILLLDALNTPLADQMYLRQEARDYLKTLKPGSRIAIFTLSMKLSFVEGFADDPVVLATALGYHKNDQIEPTPTLPSQQETNAQNTVVVMMKELMPAGPNGTVTAGTSAMIAAFQQFMEETSYAQVTDREYRTLAALQQLSTYLNAVPGRKNLIWLSGAFPVDLFGATSLRFEDQIHKTLNLLAAARVAVYPVDARGVWTQDLYTAQNALGRDIGAPQQLLGPPPCVTAECSNTGNGGFADSASKQSQANHGSDQTMDMLAESTGGKAFYSRNKLGDIIGKVVSASGNFYTLSYAPTDSKMDGSYRKINVTLEGQKYHLAFRRGYFAREEDLPGAAQSLQAQAAAQAAQTPGVDPLRPFMDFGLPQADQILYKVHIESLPPKPDAPPAAETEEHYRVDFAVDLKDLDLKLTPDGLHNGTLALSLIVYDKFGQIVSRKDHLVALNIKPDVWALLQHTGLQLHGEVDAPKGQYWLRTGVYDESTHKVGTMQVALSSLQPLHASLQPAP